MPIQPFPQLACPLEGQALLSDGSSWRCAGGHCYDIARQGYTHVLPVQNKHSRNPGDSKEMVAARQRFLNTGFYSPIATEVAKAVLDKLPPVANVLDAGCGEGYYLRQLAAQSEAHYLQVIGVDISKPAILSAARQNKNSTWIVGSNAHLPVLTGTIDRIICMFGFPTYSEFSRVLKNGGELLIVESGPDHLRELREIIYPSLKPDQPPDTKAPEGFVPLSTESLRFQFELGSAEQISDLLSMTPHLFRASTEGRTKAAALETLSLTGDVRLIRFGVIDAIVEELIPTEPTEPIESAERIEPSAPIESVEPTRKTPGSFNWQTKRPKD